MSSIDSVPPLLLGLGIIITLSAILELGYRVGKRMAGERGLSKHPVEASVTGAILSLMAFMLGFTFASGASKFTARRALVLAECNAAGTLYLRADFLKPELIKPAKDLIREYVQLRADTAQMRKIEEFTPAIERSAEIQGELWNLGNQSQGEGRDASMNMYVTALNELIDIDSDRQTTALINRFPPTLWYTIGFLCTLSITMLGVSSGLHGRRSRVATTVLIVAFSIVIILIVDLDRPIRSLFKQENTAAERALQAMEP